MTAITTRHAAPTLPDSELLRFALRADATLCAGLGLFVAMAADSLATLSGLTPTGEWITGAALVAYGATLYGAARMRDIRRVGVGVLVGNVAFIAVVGVVLVAGWLPLTAFGVVSTIAFAAVTAGFACLQYLGVRRLGTST